MRTVQAELERALHRILGVEAVVLGAGRTDAGVHALDQWASFSASTALGCAELQRALNALVGLDLEVWQLRESARALHPVRESRRKTYFYQVHRNRRVPPALRRTFAPGRGRLDIAALRAAARRLVGRHDYRSFISEADRYGSCVRQLEAVRVQELREGIRLYFTGSGFAYNMVRALVDALLDVGTGRHSVADFGRILAARDRQRGPTVAPARGLFLFRVDWSASVDSALQTTRSQRRQRTGSDSGTSAPRPAGDGRVPATDRTEARP